MSKQSLGIEYLFAGFELITKPGLKRYVIIPLFINIVLFICLFILARHFMNEFNQWFAHYLPHWLHWLSYILWVVFFASFFLVIVYTFVTLANLIAAPFNSFLAEKVELYLTGSIPEERSLIDNIKDVPRIIGRQLSILAYYLPRALLILILFFVPIIQAFATILWFLFHAWFMTLTYIDYPTDNHRVAMRDVRAFLKRQRLTAYGFGSAVLIVSMVPVLNFFVIPAAVAGATKYWIEENKKGVLNATY